MNITVQHLKYALSSTIHGNILRLSGYTTDNETLTAIMPINHLMVSKLLNYVSQACYLKWLTNLKIYSRGDLIHYSQ
jgi:hypothetical protein